MSESEANTSSTAERVLQLSLELLAAEAERKEAAAMHKENIARIKGELKDLLKQAETEQELAGQE